MNTKIIIVLIVFFEIAFLAYSTIESGLPDKFNYSRATNKKIDDALENFKEYKAIAGSNPLLDLSYLGIDTLSQYIIRTAKVEGVTEISLKDNQFKQFPTELTFLPKVKSINLSYNHISYISEDIEKLKHITHLDLSNNNLKNFPTAILKLKKLEYLNLSYNDLKTIPSDIKKLENLKYFILKDKDRNTRIIARQLKSLLPNVDLTLGN